jgi:antitoxin ParD1/3/4
LDDRDAEILDRLVESGTYEDAQEALNESLRLADLARGSDELRLAAFKAAIQVGIDDIEAGRCKTFETEEALSQYMNALLHEILNEPTD